MRRVMLVLVLALVGCRGKDTAQVAPAGQSASDSAKVAAQETRRPLWEGDRFPDIELTDLEGRPVRTSELLGGRDALIIFASTTCEACHDLVSTWELMRDQLPADVPVFGIVDEEVDIATAYAAEKSFPFPLYCDTKSTFYVDYLMDTFPTVVGVSGEGTVLYTARSASRLFTPQQAVAALAHAKAKPHQH